MPDSSVQQRFCSNCGKQGRAGAAFCVSCGTELSTPQQNADHAPQSPSNATGRERPDGVQDRDEVTEAVVTFVFAESWEESKRLVEDRRGVLLTDAADEELAVLMESNKDNEDTVNALEEHRVLLTRCRQEGIDAAFDEHLQPSPATQGDQATDAEWDQVRDAVADFVNIGPWVASKLVLKQRQDLLLTDTADEVLAGMISSNKDDEETVGALEEHRQLLARCREKGIDAAFTERSEKKQPFLEWGREWLVVIVIFILILFVIGLFA